MSDFKSKLPDLKELGSMANTLFNGIKNTVDEIVKDYKQKREEEEKNASQGSAAAAATEDKKEPPTKSE